MCGIVGYTGKQECAELLLNGLEALEYRGYDSAGIALLDGNVMSVRKTEGRIAAFRRCVQQQPLKGNTGIGHTRWATHGKPSQNNAHPQVSENGKIAVVHNGIIENYKELKERLQSKGVVFASETDTEVVAHLLSEYEEQGMLKALQMVLPQLKGSFALGVLHQNAPGTLYAARRQSPLTIGVGKGEYYISSDVSALLAHSRTVCYLEDDEIAVLTPSSALLYSTDGKPCPLRQQQVDWDQQSAQKNGFPHYMLKEIFEQPKALMDTFCHYVDYASMEIRREAMPFTVEDAVALHSISIAACGTAYHAATMGKSFIERFAGIPCRAEIASEFRYDDHITPPGELFIAVSQSGETADTLAALRREKQAGSRILVISNVIGSTISREAEQVLYTLAGPELAVASTKAYVTQVLLFALLALDLACLRGQISREQQKDILTQLAELPQQVEQILNQSDVVKEFVQKQKNCKDIFFIGRLADYYTALEAALKLKEVSYLHSEAYAAGELKHGTIALIDEATLVVGIVTQKRVQEKTLSNLEEVRARGAQLLLIAPEKNGAAEEWWQLPSSNEVAAPLLATVYSQIFAYDMALQRGCDIDKPRNLAKSVTVE